MRFLPGDGKNGEETIWPVAPLRWWRGKRSWIVVSKTLAVDTENGEPYSLSLSNAIDAFYSFAEVGKKIRNGIPIMEALEEFLVKYGVPCNEDDLIPGFPRNKDGMYVTNTGTIRYEAERAYVCAKLLKYIETGSPAKIRDMASVVESENGFLLSFFPDFDFRFEPRGLVVNKPKEGFSARDWIDIAQKVVRDIAATHAPSVAVTDALTPDGTTQLLLSLAGLSHAMWLSFRLRLADTFETKPLIKICLRDEHHQGCGQPFVAKSNREKLCPDCRIKAKALSQKKWREKKKRAMSKE